MDKGKIILSSILVLIVLAVVLSVSSLGNTPDTAIKIWFSQDSYNQGDVAVVHATLTDGFDQPMADVNMSLMIGTDIIDTSMTDASGEVTFSFNTTSLKPGMDMVTIGYDNELGSQYEYGFFKVIGKKEVFDSVHRGARAVATSRVTPVSDCVVKNWTEEVPRYGTCACNESNCTNATYDCIVGYDKVQKSKDECVTSKIVVDKVAIDMKGYVCSVDDSGTDAIVTCDSIYDGNGDGICQSGESCVKYEIDGSSYKRFEKNSKDVFVEDDSSFFAQKPDVEVQG